MHPVSESWEDEFQPGLGLVSFRFPAVRVGSAGRTALGLEARPVP